MYQVIARTWRPQKFSEVIGQRHVTQTLQNAIRLSRIGHGYIFSGQRGVGKTTVARLLAKALNCHRGPTSEPCGECDSCREITAGRSVDVIEIDAASNRGIDAVRELRENARYAPARDRYKVFIIDEAHQITPEGFNALLKTLEEPPAHVIFLLATTEIHEFPETILSRCQHFSLRALGFAEILAQLQRICEAEKIEADPEALAILAKSGEGSLRDALSRLEQAIAAFGERLEGAAVRRFLGEAPSSLMEEVFRAIQERRRERMLEIVEALVDEGYQLPHFCGQLIRAVRNLLVIRVAGADPRLLELSAEESQRLAGLAQGFTEETLMRCLEILLQVHQQLRFTMEPRFQLELGLLKLVDAERLVAIEDLVARMEATGAPRFEDRSASMPSAAKPAISEPRAQASGSNLTKPSPFEQDQLRKRQAAGASASAPAPVPDPEPSGASEPRSSTISVPSIETEISAQEEAWIQEILRQVEEQSRPVLGSLLSGATRWEFAESEVRITLSDERLAKVLTELDRQYLENLIAAIVGRKMRLALIGERRQSHQQAGVVKGNDAANSSSPPVENRVRQDPEVQEFEKLFGKRVTGIRNWKE